MRPNSWSNRSGSATRSTPTCEARRSGTAATSTDFHPGPPASPIPAFPASLDRPSLDAKVNGRLDTYGKSHADAEARFTLGTDNPGSPNIAAGLARLPIYTRGGGSLGYTQNFNRLDVTLKGGLDRISYQPSILTDGTTASNADRDYDQYSGSSRGSYELLPGVKPFAEFALDQRAHDLALDRNGVGRDSDGHDRPSRLDVRIVTASSPAKFPAAI